jgi:hypothetical protein
MTVLEQASADRGRTTATHLSPSKDDASSERADAPQHHEQPSGSTTAKTSRRRSRYLPPDRIATRIALTVVAAIVLTQVIGFLLIIGDKLPFMLPLRNIDVVTEMIAAPVQRLAITPVSDRPSVAASLSTADMTIVWQDNYRPAGADDGRLPAHILSNHVRHHLHGVVDLALMESIPDPTVSDEPPEIPLPPIFGRNGESPSGHSRLWLRLIDQSWVSIEMPNARWLQFNPVHLAIWWGLSLLSILWLSLLVAKRVTRPLQDFATAAERLGTGLDQTMLAETGPEELRQATQAFNKMQARLKRFIDDRTQMLAAISHDLRTPISRLALRASNLPPSDERRKMLADLNLMEHMIGATLDFARDDTLSEPQQ